MFSILRLESGEGEEGESMYGEWIFMGYNICKIISEKTFVLVTENFLNRGDFSCAKAGWAVSEWNETSGGGLIYV